MKTEFLSKRHSGNALGLWIGLSLQANGLLHKGFEESLVAKRI